MRSSVHKKQGKNAMEMQSALIGIAGTFIGYVKDFLSL